MPRVPMGSVLPIGRRSSSKSLKLLGFGFVLGVISFGIGSWIRYTVQQFRLATSSNDRSVHEMMSLSRKSEECDCSRKSTTPTSSKEQPNSILDQNKTIHPARPLAVTTINENPIQDFDPNAPVVIVTKTQNDQSFDQLNQSLCLLTYAYNYRVNYDIVIFSAMKISKTKQRWVQDLVAPAQVTFVVDNPGLPTMVDALSPHQKQHLLHRCNVDDAAKLTWRKYCNETTSSGTTRMRLSYTWQAEFRSLHLWQHPVLAKYKYMLWMDTDAFCTKRWQHDPIATMRRNDLVLLFDHFPGGRATGLEWIPKIKQAFNKSICDIVMRNGTLHASEGNCTWVNSLRQVYGFFHVTNLDFYRSDPVMNWQRIMIGDTKFSRIYDDQMAVTLPAAVLAGNRSWHMKYFGIDLSIAHNNWMDGNKKQILGPFTAFWHWKAPRSFPEAYGHCSIVDDG